MGRPSFRWPDGRGDPARPGRYCCGVRPGRHRRFRGRYWRLLDDALFAVMLGVRKREGKAGEGFATAGGYGKDEACFTTQGWRGRAVPNARSLFVACAQWERS
ncbi:MAG: hypothetical protein GXP17_02560 [Gammaproteobacteria bacterium]|nr:hypothetical protein [Gammaproteobacteria bacterium]